MSYEINYNTEQNYIAITIEGEFKLSTIKELATDVASFIDHYNCNYILNDLRLASLTDETLDIYNMPKQAKQAGVKSYVKRALVVSELSSNLRFLETVFINQGHIVMMFTDIDDALQWLLNEEKNTRDEPGDRNAAQPNGKKSAR